MAPNKPKNKSKTNGKSNVEENPIKTPEKISVPKEVVEEKPKEVQSEEKIEAQNLNDQKPEQKLEPAKEETIEEIAERVKSNSTHDEKDLKTIEDVLKKLDLDSEDFNAEQKLNALCIIFREVVAVNVRLRDSNSNLTEQVLKTEQTKEALQKLCGALRTQILLTKEEGELKVRDETQRRIEVSENFQKTIEELGTLMSTHFETNTKLKDENVLIGKQMKELLEQFENRQEKYDHLTTEHKLQMELYDAKLNKAKLEKAEMSTDFTRERLELHKSLVEAKNHIDILLTREENLMEQIELYKFQATELQNTLSELSNAPTNAQTSFAHFRTEIDKLSKRMKMMEKDSAEWKEKFEASNDQVRRMNSLTMEKEKEISLVKKKLAAMENLNRVLSKERNDLLGQMKAQNGQKST